MKIIPFAFLMLLVLACSLDKGKEASDVALGDTVTTASGVRYFYLKKGEGRPVETGCKLSTYLALSVDGKEVWNTNDAPDSAFVFVANKDRMIKGFTEVTMLLREGDEIVAILPPDLAYGEKGSGAVIPPNATLVYTQYKMRKVSEPKLSMSDTLFQAMKTKGYDGMAAEHKRITGTGDSSAYYIDSGQWRILWNLLSEANMHAEAIRVIDFGMKRNEGSARYYRVRSYDKMGNYKLAIDSLTALIKSDTSYTMNTRALNYLKELQGKL